MGASCSAKANGDFNCDATVPQHPPSSHPNTAMLTTVGGAPPNLGFDDAMFRARNSVAGLAVSDAHEAAKERVRTAAHRGKAKMQAAMHLAQMHDVLDVTGKLGKAATDILGGDTAAMTMAWAEESEDDDDGWDDAADGDELWTEEPIRDGERNNSYLKGIKQEEKKQHLIVMHMIEKLKDIDNTAELIAQQLADEEEAIEFIKAENVENTKDLHIATALVRKSIVFSGGRVADDSDSEGSEGDRDYDGAGPAKAAAGEGVNNAADGASRKLAVKALGNAIGGILGL